MTIQDSRGTKLFFNVRILDASLVPYVDSDDTVKPPMRVPPNIR